MTLVPTLGFAFLYVCASHPVHHAQQAMTVDAEGDVTEAKMKQLMRSHPDVSASLEESEILPSAADLAYKAMDLGFGTTGMALDDYPFACICTAEGKCDMDPAETTCKLRPGLNSAGRLSFHMLLWTSLWVLMARG